MDENSTLIDFGRICRLCMTEEPTMCSIFCDEVGSVPLPLKIMACVSIEVNQTEKLPRQICNTCLCQVDSWYKFKDLCENTDATLRKLIRQEPVHCEEITKILTTAGELKKSFPSTVEKIDASTSPAEPFYIIEEPEAKETEAAVTHNERPEEINVTSDETIQVTSCKVESDAFLAEEDSDGNDAEQMEEQNFPYADVLQNGTETLPGDENGADDYSSDDNLTLLAQREKLMSDKRTKKRVRAKKVIDADKEQAKLLRTVQTQTSMEDGESGCFIIQTEKCIVNQLIEDESQRKRKNRRTQTQRLPAGKKRFRVRPAVPSACTLCEKVYKNSEILRQHMKSHHVSGTIECPECRITFTSLRSLKYHEQRKHSDLEPLPCSFCGKKFLDKKYLRIHENIHSQTNQYVCQFCGRKFIMKTNLTVHISRHHTQKTNDFICQVCGKAFPFKLYLKKHFKTHTDYKPHECSYCDSRFRESTLLRKHINSIHLKLRPFQCLHCSKNFTRSLYLREHMESQHLGIPRKVECSRCGESFQNRSRLRQHECENRLEVLQ